MYEKIKECIDQYSTIIIHRHSRPDGDALGSQLGLYELIKENYDNKEVYVVGDMTNRFNFLREMDDIFDEKYHNALVFALDSSDLSLISDQRVKQGAYLIKIDHHIYKETYADYELIDESFESCAGLIADMAIELNWTINEKAAEYLFLGIVTDSGRFRYDATSSRTFNTVATLLDKGVDFIKIYNKIYSDDLNMVLLRAKFTLKMKFTDHNVAYIKTTDDELKEMNVELFTVSRSMVNTMAGIKDIDIWVNFTEDKANDRVICEIRSSKYNINPIAVKYGGGGHAKASGASVASFEVADQILNELDELCKNNGEYLENEK